MNYLEINQTHISTRFVFGTFVLKSKNKKIKGVVKIQTITLTKNHT